MRLFKKHNPSTYSDLGGIAQLVERRNGIAKVRGSTPLTSTINRAALLMLLSWSFIATDDSFAVTNATPDEHVDCAGTQKRLDEFQVRRAAPAQAVAVVAHGFNLKPDKLAALIESLNQQNVRVLRLTLTGHDGDYAQMQQVTRVVWLRDMECATRAGASKSQELHVPLYFVGVSLGALLNVDYINQSAVPYYDKRVLLVPAIRLNWYTHALRGLNALPFDVDVPSRSPVDYRVHDHLPMAAYNAVFASAAAVSDVSAVNLAIPTLIFAAADDELVDYQAIARLIEEHPQSKWTLQPLDNVDSDVVPHYAHNAVDPKSMGPSLWSKFSVELASFLGLSDR